MTFQVTSLPTIVLELKLQDLILTDLDHLPIQKKKTDLDNYNYNYNYIIYGRFKVVLLIHI